MDNAYNYDESELEEGITLKKVGYFFKKAWLRMIIYLVVALALASAVVLPVKFLYKSERVGLTSIEFIYEGIEEGLDPNGGVLNTDNIISTTVLDKAVEASELTDVITDISKLRASMRVDGVETEEYRKLVEAASRGDSDAASELRTYVMRPTQFEIIISEPQKLGLSDVQAKTLLSHVVAEFCKDFKSRYTVSNMFSSDAYVLSQNAMLEYADMYDLYMQTFDPIETYLNRLAAEAPAFTATDNNTTFATLLSNLSVIKRSYDAFNSYILSNNVWRDIDNALSALAESKTQKQNELTAQQAYLESIIEIKDSIKPNTITSNVNGQTITTEAYPKEYYVWLERVDTENAKVKTLTNQLNNITLRYNKLTASSEKPTDVAVEYVSKTIVQLENMSKIFVDKVNDTVTEYYDTTFIAQSVRAVRSPVVMRMSIQFNILIIYACVVLAALLAASLVTVIKISKRNAKEKKAALANAACNSTADDDAADSDEVNAQSAKSSDQKRNKK